jgi:hypothetical protein
MFFNESQSSELFACYAPIRAWSLEIGEDLERA